MSTRSGRGTDSQDRANEGSRRLESRRRACQTGVALTSDAPPIDRMHSRREGALKTQRIESPFSRGAKNCLTGYVRNYSVRSARGRLGKPIRAEAWGIVFAGSARQVKLPDDSRQRNASSAALTTPTKMQAGFTTPCWFRTTYVIMATKTGPHAVSTILPIA